MRRILMVYGTDVPAHEVEAAGFEWEPSTGHTMAYRGQHPNPSHSMEHRSRYHVPLFRREQNRQKADRVVEWWFSNWRMPAGEKRDGPGEDERAETVVRYRPSDPEPVAAARRLDDLAAAHGSARNYRLEACPALEGDGLRDSVIVETVLPAGSAPPRRWENSVNDMLDLVETMARS